MPDERDPLESLLVDSAEIDRRALAEGLAGLLAVDKDNGSLHFRPGFGKLDAAGKVLAVLLGQKAARLLKVTTEEPLSNKEITDLTGLPSGTAAPSLKKLRGLRLVAQDEQKRYYVPTPKLRDALAVLNKEG